MRKDQQPRYKEKKFLPWVAAAAALHLLLFVVAIYFQIVIASREVKPHVVTVTLVSRPGAGGLPGIGGQDGGAEAGSAKAPAPAPAPAPAKPAKALPEKKALPEPPHKASPAVKKVALEPQKPKAVEKPADIQKALDRLKQSVEKKAVSSQPTPQPAPGANINDALAKLQKSVQSGSGGGRGSASGGRGGGVGGSGGSGTGGPYNAVVASIIQQNWEFSRALLKNSYGMEVYVHVNILADGTIREIRFDRRSPSEYLNNSVKRALEKSSPLPVPPKEGGAREIWIGFVFTPEGIKQ